MRVISAGVKNTSVSGNTLSVMLSTRLFYTQAPSFGVLVPYKRAFVNLICTHRSEFGLVNVAKS